MMPKTTQKNGLLHPGSDRNVRQEKFLPKSHAIKESDMRRVVKSVRWAWLGR
jgi:hypothetical protein